MPFPPGFKNTPETYAKIAESNRGKKRTPEQRARMSEAMKGKPHPKARKDRYILNGYVKTWDGDTLVWEHRMVMERMLGRKMLPAPKEQVHHKNGDKTDNRPENLELRTGNHGAGATHHCPTCQCT